MIRPYGAHGVPWRPPHLAHLPCCLTLSPAAQPGVSSRALNAHVLGLARRRPAPGVRTLISRPRESSSLSSSSSSSSSCSSCSRLLLRLPGGQPCHRSPLALPHIGSSSLQSLQGQHHQPHYQHHHLKHSYPFQQTRGKKTSITVRLSDLPQGLIKRDPLPPLEDSQDEPVYPTVVLQARQNMRRFDNCVLLTRVGGFYELYFEHAEKYGPLLNLKVASKRTNAGPVPMVSHLHLNSHLT